jgi:opacity protein-like surface antigen
MIARLAVLAGCCLGTVAHAADNGFYFGVGAGRSDYNLDSALKNKDTGYKLLGGVRLLDSFGVELNYADHGKASLPSGTACVAVVGANCPANSRVEAKTIAAYAVGFLDFPLIDLFGKAGLARVDGELNTPGQPSFSFDSDKTKFAWGGGVQAHFGSLAARAEYEQFKLFGDEKLGTVSVSFIYTIL